MDAVATSLAQTHSSLEVLVIDNASVDGTADAVRDNFGERVEVIRFEKNFGYTGGYNRAFRLARGEFFLVLNPDARLEADYVEKALPAFEDERVGMVAGLLLRADRQTVDSSGQFLARSRCTLDRGYGRPASKARDRAGTILAACGAAAMYRRRMVEDLADDGEFFDAGYFAYHEDLEVGWRAWRAGWRALFVPEAIAIHLRGSGQGGQRGVARIRRMLDRPAAIQCHILKNRYLAMIRHDAFTSICRDLPWILWREATVMPLLVLRRPDVLRRLWRHRRLFRRAWRQRREDRRRRGVWGPWSRQTPPRGVW